LAKPTKSSAVPPNAVRTRRAYFDCQFGQLHVRTAFPTTGGFDEQVTLFCLHPAEASSRTFSRFLPAIADQRSVYAPDLPGCGESDPAPTRSFADAAVAVSDLANGLRLRRIDLLGLGFGAGVALEAAAARPELVRRLVLVGALAVEGLPVVKQPCFILRIKPEPADGTARIRAAVPNAKFVDLCEYADDLFDAAPNSLAKQISSYLEGS
jgi:pimeloyl-ACP methyl ester carboxylesterase